MSRMEGRVEVKPAARRICRIGGRRREGWRGLVDIKSFCFGGELVTVCAVDLRSDVWWLPWQDIGRLL